MTTLPLFSYPTTISWVDDDNTLLQAASDTLGDEIQIKTFNSPTAYLNFIETYVPHLETISFLRGRTESGEFKCQVQHDDELVAK